MQSFTGWKYNGEDWRDRCITKDSFNRAAARKGGCAEPGSQPEKPPRYAVQLLVTETHYPVVSNQQGAVTPCDSSGRPLRGGRGGGGGVRGGQAGAAARTPCPTTYRGPT